MNGIAEYRIFTVGAGAVSTIPVPLGGYIVITDFIWHPFIDEDLSDTLKFPGDNRNTKQLQLRSGHKNVNYLFRDQIAKNISTLGTVSYALEPKIQIHCLHKFTEDIYVDVIVVPASVNWVAASFKQTNSESGEAVPPNGYGINPLGDAVLTDFQFDPLSSTYNVLGQKRNIMTVSGRYTEEFHADYGDGIAPLNNPAAFPMNQSNSNYPLISFGFVQFNKTP